MTRPVRSSTRTRFSRLRSTIIVLLGVLATSQTSPCNGVTAEPSVDSEKGTTGFAKVVVHYHDGKEQVAPYLRGQFLLNTEGVHVSLQNPRVTQNQIRDGFGFRTLHAPSEGITTLKIEAQSLDRMLLAAYEKEFPDFLPEVYCLTIWDDFGAYAGIAMGTHYFFVATMAPYCSDTFDAEEGREAERMTRNRYLAPQAFSSPRAPLSVQQEWAAIRSTLVVPWSLV